MYFSRAGRMRGQFLKQDIILTQLRASSLDTS